MNQLSPLVHPCDSLCFWYCHVLLSIVFQVCLFFWTPVFQVLWIVSHDEWGSSWRGIIERLLRDGHVTGGKDIDRKSFTYDFALPAEIKHVKQYKTELISMNLSHVASVLEGFTQKPRSGDSWGIMNSSQWPCTNFCYFEQNGKYACEGSYYYGPSKRMEGKRYEEAINTVSALLKALHVPVLLHWSHRGRMKEQDGKK